MNEGLVIVKFADKHLVTLFTYIFSDLTGKYEIKSWKSLEILVYEYEWIFISYLNQQEIIQCSLLQQRFYRLYRVTSIGNGKIICALALKIDCSRSCYGILTLQLVNIVLISLGWLSTMQYCASCDRCIIMLRYIASHDKKADLSTASTQAEHLEI